MKERPILFSAPMVRAILEGSKTQTRRLVKIPDFVRGEPFDCPYGKVGDRLWVRETWKYWDWTEDGMPWIKYQADDETKFFDSCIPEEWSDRVEQVWAELSVSNNYEIDQAARDYKWRPSIFLPRWASRILLEITGVRIERLNDISVGDCCAEGAPLDQTHAVETWYQELWESINGAGSWAANPWVWVIKFKALP
jgi:hypothetical protein